MGKDHGEAPEMKAAGGSKQPKIYALDAMRGLLILSIVLIHTLQVYNPEHRWLIYSQDGLWWAPYLIEILMLFTLPSFFMMSGYLAAMSIEKGGTDRFFESRIKRIFIPIVTTALTLNSLQTYFLVKSGWQDFSLDRYIVEGQWISHLWFLIDLAIFFFFTYLAVKYLRVPLRYIDGIIGKYLGSINIFVILSLFIVFTIGLLALFSLFSAYLYNPIVDVRSLAFYFPFYLLGVFMYRYQSFFKNLLSLRLIILLFLTLVILFSYYSLSSEMNAIEKIIYYFFDVGSHLFASILCFLLFYRWLNMRSEWMEQLADASYTIYLFHHLLVIVLGLLLLKLRVNVYMALPILFISSAGISFFIHRWVIRKNLWLGFLFNGRRRPDKDIDTTS